MIKCRVHKSVAEVTLSDLELSYVNGLLMESAIAALKAKNFEKFKKSIRLATICEDAVSPNAAADPYRHFIDSIDVARKLISVAFKAIAILRRRSSVDLVLISEINEKITEVTYAAEKSERIIGDQIDFGVNFADMHLTTSSRLIRQMYNMSIKSDELDNLIVRLN